MNKITVTINIGNCEMQTAQHAADALRTLAKQLEQGLWEPRNIAVFDDNGNRVGTATLS